MLWQRGSPRLPWATSYRTGSDDECTRFYSFSALAVSRAFALCFFFSNTSFDFKLLGSYVFGVSCRRVTETA